MLPLFKPRRLGAKLVKKTTAFPVDAGPPGLGTRVDLSFPFLEPPSVTLHEPG